MRTSAPVVSIRQGRVRGTSDGTVAAFRGIPFAASPVAGLRFRPPEPDPGWSGVMDGTRPGPAVPQGRSRLASVMGDGDESWDEDGCLNLNVWAPESALDGRSPRPVLVWFHGGGFTSGSGGRAWYDGTRLAEAGGIVVVTANYRLGALGYLRLPEIGADNLGCQDQAAVLRWVRGTIAAFGGDPGRVTVGGQSAGAYSALALAIDPATGHLVHRVIAQSGPWALSPQEPADADAAAARYLRILGIGAELGAGSGASRLRKVPAAELVSAYGELAAQTPRSRSLAPPMFPVLGGAGFPLAWPEAVAHGRLDGRLVLLGRTEDEITAFLAMSPSLAPEGDAAAVAAATEEQFGAGITAIAAACAAQGAPARVYRFTRVSAAVPALGATHCSDLPFAFDNLGAYASAPMLGPVDDRDRALARSLAAALAGFAAGDQEAERGWAPWRAGDGRYVRYF